MADWEDEFDGGDKPPQQGFDPNAGFNLGANSFVPSFTAPAFVPGGAFVPPPAQQPTYGGPPGGYGQPGYGQAGFAQPPNGIGQPQYGAPPPQQQQQYWQPGQGQPAPPAQPGNPVAAPSDRAAAAPPPRAVAPPVAAPVIEVKAAAAPAPKAAPKTEPSAEPKAEPKEEPAKSAPAPKKSVSSSKAAAPAAVHEGISEQDQKLLDNVDKREHVNVIFTGHVDAGKSTIGGHLMFLTGGVDKRTLEKYEREAKEKNRESWYLSWALDTSEEERAKGKTVECGKATFHTEKKHYTIIDAPGHKSFVPSMITGAVQADIAILVISTRTGEFEAGFERGGQTREHAMLAKSVGVKKLVVVMNKMDLCDWSEARYQECEKKLMPFLKSCGFSPKKDVFVMPLSGQLGLNLITPLPEGVCPWYKGPCLVQYLDEMGPVKRYLDLPFRMPVADKYSEMGTYAIGKVLSGAMKVGQKLTLMPNGLEVQCTEILINDEKTEICQSGDSIKVKLKGADEESLQAGYVLCQDLLPCSVCYSFDAQINVLEYKSIIAAGFQCMVHCHTAIEEVTLKLLIVYMDKKTGKPDKSKGKPRFMRQGDSVVCRLECVSPVCVESFKENPTMGRFSLRDEGKTIAVGKILKLVSLEKSQAEAKAAAAAAIAD